MPPDPTITVDRELDAPAEEAVRRLVADSAAVDGSSGLNESALLHLKRPDDRVRHLRATLPGELIGYAQLEAGAGQTTGQLLVAPEHRRRGLGTHLVGRMLAEAAPPLQIWAVGDRPAAQALAARTGLRPGRTLLIMKRSLADLPDPVPVPGVRIRTFVAGRDEEAWLAVNAAAFVDHPEQGRITIHDLRDRMAESWFDPDGFFLASRDDAMVGFHWTKQHPNRLGEVYVLGVDPAAGGQGLGKALLLTGLRHLEQQGNSGVQLYVEAVHARAVGLYQAYGFSTVSRDVMYAQQAEPAAQEM